MRTIVGLCGYAGSGKDEAAKVLIEQRGFVKVSFADPLRAAMTALDPIVGVRFGAFGGSDVVRFADAIENHGYTEAKQKFPEVRELLQKFGTEVGRNMFGTNFWVEQAKRRIDAIPQSTPIVITDVRFPNEVDLVRSYFGCMVRILRPGVKAVNEHVSDAGVCLLSVDSVLINDGSIDDLHEKILGLVETAVAQPSLFPVTRAD